MPVESIVVLMDFADGTYTQVVLESLSSQECLRRRDMLLMNDIITLATLPKMLYVGPLLEGGTCLQRLRLFREMGCQVEAVDSAPLEVSKAEAKLYRRVQRKLFGVKDWAKVNQRVLSAVNKETFDILWIDKGLVIERQTLEEVKRIQPECAVVGYLLDDPMAKGCTSRQFVEHLPLYDLFFTNKSFAVADLTRMGCRRVEFFDNTFDPNTHHPIAVTAADRERLGGPVGFIGDYEWERGESIRMLAENGVPVRVWGTNWDRMPRPPKLVRLEHKPVFSRDYAQAICAFDVNLGFLRKLSRDLQTTRSVEIPACGAFMLAERTTEHQRLFQEGLEAEFFSSDEELLRKARYYLEHEDQRNRIARAGQERCLKDGHSARETLALMLGRVQGLRSANT